MEASETPLLAGEMKELRRVYDYLCFFLPKNNLRKKLVPRLERRNKIVTHRKNPDAVKIYDDNGSAMTEEEIDDEYESLSKEIEDLEEQIAAFDQREERKVRPQDLNEAIKVLGKRCSKREIEDMIWEVDENLDGCVDWSEFKLMYERNITDKTGLEPFQLFNVVQFMMYDKDNSGKVSIDETMTMLFQRYGKDKLEAQMKLLFGEDLKAADGDGELSFDDYLRAVNVRLPRSRALRGTKPYPPPSGQHK